MTAVGVLPAAGMRQIAGTVILACAVVAATAAPLQPAPFPQELRIYSAPSPQRPAQEMALDAHRARLVASGAYGSPDDFAGSARVAFKTEKRALAQLRAFSPEFPSEVPPGWKRDGALFWASKSTGTNTPVLSLPFAVSSAAEPFRLLDYDEIWLDHARVEGVPLCDPQIELVMGPATPAPGAPGLVIRGASSVAPKALVVLEAAAGWREKDASYLLRRILGFAPDEVWRYAQEGGNAVFQRRMHVALHRIDLLEVVAGLGVEIRHVNLRVQTAAGTEIVQFPDLRPSALPEGQVGVRLNLGAMKKRLGTRRTGAGEPSFTLLEISVFAAGDARALAATHPLRRLAFLGDGDRGGATEGTDPAGRTMPTTTASIGGGAQRARMIVDLRELAAGERPLHQLRLKLGLPAGAASCALGIDALYAANPYTGDWPRFARSVEFWSQRWGHVFTSVPPQPGFVEAPGFLVHFFFADLTTSPGAQKPKPDDPEGGRERARRIVPLPYRIVSREGRSSPLPAGRFLSSNGATMRASDGWLWAVPEAQQLLVEGQARHIDVEWSVNGRITPGTWFYLSLPEGADQIDSVLLSLDLSDGRTAQRRVVPNLLRRLEVAQGELRRVRMRIFPARQPYRFKLEEMRLFDPGPASYGDSLSIRLPAPHTVKPLPVVGTSSGALLEVQPGRIAGLARQLGTREPLRFSTPIEPPLAPVRGLRLGYRLPPAYLEEEACPLRLEFHWERARMVRDVCLSKLADDILVPIADWLGEQDNAQDLGLLRSIDWSLRSPSGSDVHSIESFELRFEIEGRAALSAADQLELLPIFIAGGIPAHLAAPEVRKIVATPYSSAVHVPLEAKTISTIFAAGGQIHALDHPLFAVEEVFLHPRKSLTPEQWHQLNSLPGEAAPSRLPRWLPFAAALIFLALLAWQPGPAARVWRGAARMGGRAWKGLSQAASGAGTRAIAWLPNLNILIALLAIGPGLWLAGRFGFEFRGYMLLAFAAVVAWASYQHRDRPVDAAGTSPRWATARTAVLVATIGCAIWALGRFGPSMQAGWGFLPLAGAAYAFVPMDPARITRASSRARYWATAAAWLFVAACLYLVGQPPRHAGTPNYALTLAALAVVFSGRAILLALRNLASRHLPALAAHVYDRPSGVYFAQAIMALLAVMATVIPNRQGLPEHLATVAYFCIFIGVLKEALACRRQRLAPATVPADFPPKHAQP
jgi:hypothetical protein